MNKEAIERTKARCKKEIKYRDKILIAPGWYINKSDYSNCSGIGPQSYLCGPAKLGELVQVPNDWIPETRGEVLVVIILTSIILVLFAWLVLL